MLELKGVTKRFHAGTADERTALDAVTLSLERGAFAVIIGSNGSGKSTLLNVIAGEVPPDEGDIVLEDRPIGRLAGFRRARWIARVFQDPMLGTAPSMTVEENMILAELRGTGHRCRFGRSASRRERFRDALAKLGLGLEDRVDDKVGRLSGGQRQSLSLMMAVLKEPRLLLLDEHTAALDPRTAERVMAATVNAIADHGLSALMVTHNMSHAIDHGDRVMMMEAGRIKLDASGEEKAGLTVEALVERFHVTDDRILLAS